METDSLSLVVSQKQEKKSLKFNIANLVKKVEVRKANEGDAELIYTIASSVGKSTKDSQNGFLMDNYISSPRKYKDLFRDRLKELKYFYIAEANGEPMGFLMGYTKEEWLKYNPDWIDDINWSPMFDMKKTEKFVLTDKIAINSKYTGKGIGSKIYKKYIKDLKDDGINTIFSETLISPTPNFASLSFRKKQKFKLAGTRFEKYRGNIYTDLVYYKPVK